MQVTAFEGVVEDGQIRLKTQVRLPEKTKVYVVVPDYEAKHVVHVFSPRLLHPEQAADFTKVVVKDAD
jgi:hypothetical protein